MNFKQVLLACLVVAALSALAVWTLTTTLAQTGDVHVQEYHFAVSDRLGVDVATEDVRLGAITPGAVTRRDVTISTAVGATITTTFSGPGSNWLQASPQQVTAQTNTTTITLSAHPPETAEHANYTGEVIFRIR